MTINKYCSTYTAYICRVDTYINIETNEWLEGKCTEENCSFCTNRLPNPFNNNYKKQVYSIYMYIKSSITYPKWTLEEQRKLKLLFKFLDKWFLHDIYNVPTIENLSDNYKEVIESIVFLFNGKGERFYGERFNSVVHWIDANLRLD